MQHGGSSETQHTKEFRCERHPFEMRSANGFGGLCRYPSLSP